MEKLTPVSQVDYRRAMAVHLETVVEDAKKLVETAGTSESRWVGQSRCGVGGWVACG